MAWNKIVLSPVTGENGYAVFLEVKETKKPMINVLTEKYVKRIVPLANAIWTNNLKASYPNLGDYKPPDDGDPQKSEKMVKSMHDLLMMTGQYNDMTPHTLEIADQLLDYNESISDPNQAIIDIRRRYQLMFNGTVLIPGYPEMLPTPFIPLPRSPI
jgi:hypothetical protein